MTNWARSVATRYTRSMECTGDKNVPWDYPVADGVLSKIRAMLGFDRCKWFSTGAAPCERKVFEFFHSIGIPVMEVFGMSENSGPVTFNRNYHYQVGSVGPAMEGIEVQCRPREDENDPAGTGEVCMRGRMNMMGYMYNPEKTRATIDDQGWVHSGDLGLLDAHKNLSITGRIKEMIITAGGENIAPVPIEDKIKDGAGILANCMTIGDRRKYMTCLVSLLTAPGSDETPTVHLAPEVQQVCDSKTVEEATKDPKIHAIIQKAIDGYNAVAKSRAQKIQYFRILPSDFSRPIGELGPTLKLKRGVVMKKYSDVIESMYLEE